MAGWAARKFSLVCSEQQMDLFYRQLGIRSLRNPPGENIRHALKMSSRCPHDRFSPHPILVPDRKSW